MQRALSRAIEGLGRRGNRERVTATGMVDLEQDTRPVATEGPACRKGKSGERRG